MPTGKGDRLGRVEEVQMKYVLSVRRSPRSGGLTLAVSFKAREKVNPMASPSRQRRMKTARLEPSPLLQSSLTRRKALVLDVHPALKNRAKFSTPLRGGDAKQIDIPTKFA
jgi:hypothetical protein